MLAKTIQSALASVSSGFSQLWPQSSLGLGCLRGSLLLILHLLGAILTSIQSLLSDPNPASPANMEASQLYERDRREYNKRVRAVVENSWMVGAEEMEDEKEGPSETAEAKA